MKRDVHLQADLLEGSWIREYFLTGVLYVLCNKIFEPTNLAGHFRTQAETWTPKLRTATMFNVSNAELQNSDGGARAARRIQIIYKRFP